ncbi:MAG: hypothetical protein QNJ51_26200 [Calothrix sp. MO_167.B12]|nr:hypothetical protein [Calothrix sp. MO_167.B12]
MRDSHTFDQDNRLLQKSLTNKIIDNYFDNTESWLRAILRMCVFSLTHLDGEPVFMVECPNQAVAKRLSRKIYPFQGIVYYLTTNFNTSDRSLFCYQERNGGDWHCFDTSTSCWISWNHLQ